MWPGSQPNRRLFGCSALSTITEVSYSAIAPELRKYLPGEAYQQVDFGREADYIYRALSAFFLEIATLQSVFLSSEDCCNGPIKGSLDLLRHMAAALANASRRPAPTAPWQSAPRLVIVTSARTGYASLEEALMVPLRDREQRQLRDCSSSPLAESETRELIALRLELSAR